MEGESMDIFPTQKKEYDPRKTSSMAAETSQLFADPGAQEDEQNQEENVKDSENAEFVELIDMEARGVQYIFRTSKNDILSKIADSGFFRTRELLSPANIECHLPPGELFQLLIWRNNNRGDLLWNEDRGDDLPGGLSNELQTPLGYLQLLKLKSTNVESDLSDFKALFKTENVPIIPAGFDINAFPRYIPKEALIELFTLSNRNFMRNLHELLNKKAEITEPEESQKIFTIIAKFVNLFGKLNMADNDINAEEQGHITDFMQLVMLSPDNAKHLNLDIFIITMKYSQATDMDYRTMTMLRALTEDFKKLKSRILLELTKQFLLVLFKNHALVSDCGEFQDIIKKIDGVCEKTLDFNNSIKAFDPIGYGDFLIAQQKFNFLEKYLKENNGFQKWRDGKLTEEDFSNLETCKADFEPHQKETDVLDSVSIFQELQKKYLSDTCLQKLAKMIGGEFIKAKWDPDDFAYIEQSRSKYARLGENFPNFMNMLRRVLIGAIEQVTKYRANEIDNPKLFAYALIPIPDKKSCNKLRNTFMQDPRMMVVSRKDLTFRPYDKIDASVIKDLKLHKDVISKIFEEIKEKDKIQFYRFNEMTHNSLMMALTLKLVKLLKNHQREQILDLYHKSRIEVPVIMIIPVANLLMADAHDDSNAKVLCNSTVKDIRNCLDKESYEGYPFLVRAVGKGDCIDMPNTNYE